MTDARIIGATRPEIEPLTGLRALAASWVVLEHFRQPLYALIPGTAALAPQVQGGYLGVEVFFVLSGFIIAYNYADRFERFRGRTYGNFLLARFGRIYPVHLVTLVIVAVLVVAASVAHVTLSAAAKYTPWDFGANVLMLQAISPFEAVNGPAWSICCEAAAYLAFPGLALLLPRLRTAAAGLGAAAATAVVGAAAMFLLATSTDGSPTGAVLWFRILFEFSCGALLFAGWRRLRARRGRGWDVVAVAAGLALLTALAAFPAGSALSLLLLPLIALFVLGCASSVGFLARFLSSRFMRWGGRISYSVYMTHFIVLMIVGKILPWDHFAGSSLLVRLAVMVGYYAVVVAVGAGMYHLVEEPARKQIRRWSGSRLREPVARAIETS